MTTSGKEDPTTRLLLACGTIGPLLFIVVLLTLGATRPGYSAWHHFGSLLSLSEWGWMQITNFLVCGLLLLCFTVGVWRVLWPGKSATWGPILLGLFGLSLIVSGLFSTDPALGYPPGALSTGLSPHTLHGAIHGISGYIAFGSLAAAIFTFVPRFMGDPDWKGWWTASTIAAGILFVVFSMAMIVASDLDQAGVLQGAPICLLQRLAIIIGWSWLSLFAFRLMRRVKQAGY